MSIFSEFISSQNSSKKEDVGIGGFKTLAIADIATRYTSTVPTVVLEDGSFASDDIINNPVTINISGVVGDIYDESVGTLQDISSKAYPEVGQVLDLLPRYAVGKLQQLQQLDAINKVNEVLNSDIARVGGKVYDLISGNISINKSLQERFIEFIEAVHYSRTPITISTRYRNYENMALNDLNISEDNQTNLISFSAQFTEIQYSTIEFTEVASVLQKSKPSQAVGGKVASKANKGGQAVQTNEQPTSQEQSLLGTIIGFF